MKIHWTSPRVSMPMAAAAGLAHYYLVALAFWQVVGLHLPYAMWLVHAGLRGAVWWATVIVCDLVLNILIAMPAAWVVLRVAGTRVWPHLLVAVLPYALWFTPGLVLDPMDEWLRWTTFYVGALPLCFLPAAAGVWLWAPRGLRRAGLRPRPG